MGKRMLAALALLVAASVVHAAGPRAAMERVEASMLVGGTIDVDPQGRVERFELDQRDKLPADVDRLLVKVVPGWRFEPTVVDGQPAAVRTPMRIRVAANQVPGQDDAYVLRVASASFGDLEEGGLRAERVHPPAYPREPLHKGVQGPVFLLVKVGRTGAVEDVVAEQVNLQLVGSERLLRRMRTSLSRAAIRAAHGWTFVPPTVGDDVDAPYWTARVPIDFRFRDPPGYGEWTSYVPGPRQAAPWNVEDTAAGADSFAANQVYQVGKGLKLLTPLGG